MSTIISKEAKLLYVFGLRSTSHNNFSSRIHGSPIEWDLPFEQPNLSELFAFYNVTGGLRGNVDHVIYGQYFAARAVLAKVNDATDFQWIPGSHQSLAYDARDARCDHGPFWVVLPPDGTHWDVRFSRWIRDIKRQTYSRQERLDLLRPYRVFNKEICSEIARLRENGSCPIREWNRSPFERASRDR